MTSSTLRLVPHPGAAAPAGIDITVFLRREPGRLQLRYCISGEIAQLQIPAPATTARIDGLWEHLCCEVFLREGDKARYLEYNFSPSGEWALYAFSDYREGQSKPDSAFPQIVCQRQENRLTLQTELRLAAPTGLRAGLSVVLEETSGRLSYWALRHPNERPDFHHPDAFVLDLE